jgi:hypothetical protein
MSVSSVPGLPAVAFWSTPGDPTGMSSPLGRLVILAGLLASLTLLLRWWWTNRRR